LVSQPVSQIVPQREFDWDAPQLFGATIDYDWILVEQHARHLRELRLIWYNSHDAPGGFGGLSLAPLGQFLVAWTIRSEDVDGQGIDVETPRVG
jgi:hypothetical protein